MLWVASTLVEFTAAYWVLFHRRRGDGDAELITLGIAAQTVLLTVAVLAAKTLGLRLVGLNVFGFIHLVYLDLVLLVPVVSGMVLCSGRIRFAHGELRRTTRAVRCLALGGLGMLPVGVYASWIEPFRLQLEAAVLEIPSTRVGSEPIRIGILADTQTDRVTAYEHRAFDHLMAQEPDIIILPGDLFQGTREALEQQRDDLRELLGKLSASGGVYMVLGNVDRRSTTGPLLAGTPVRLLVNEIVRLTVKDRLVTIGGVELDFMTEEAQRVIEQLESDQDADDIRILVSHYPDSLLHLSPATRVDLIIAGHTHGGQVSIPLFGPPLTLTAVPRRIAAGGLHELDGRHIYVSRGVGCERGQAPRIRFLCPPEITVLTLIDRK